MVLGVRAAWLKPFESDSIPPRNGAVPAARVRGGGNREWATERRTRLVASRFLVESQWNPTLGVAVKDLVGRFFGLF